MLFTTATFALAFLPFVLATYFLVGHYSHRSAAAWLFGASVFFYGYWMPEFTALLLGSIAMNFWVGRRLIQARVGMEIRRGRLWLLSGLFFNLGLLAWFKYSNFLLDNYSTLTGAYVSKLNIILPIGISFYSFTQIAYLVDTFHGKVKETDPVHYGLFVTYFPHLVAGPVLHHAQMMPQFASHSTYRLNAGNFCAGILIFALGLIKKIILADGISPYADAVFNAADTATAVSSSEAWLGALAYTAQLYFDFSGYSDMAIGISLMFNVRLPFNFNSPYQSVNISEFWRRWHISLSTFLRDYLYITLGGNRRGAVRRYFNLGITMVLGGLWHGASWSFVVWGALHGVYLMVNHGFQVAMPKKVRDQFSRSLSWRLVAWCVTMICVVVAWVFFRAQTLAAAIGILCAMFGVGAAVTEPTALWNAGLAPATGGYWCLVTLSIAAIAPNSNRIGEWLVERLRPPGHHRVVAATAGSAMVMALVGLNGARESVSAFIYFNF